MKKLLFLLTLCSLYNQSFSQCTPALVRATTSINTPTYTLNTKFNANTTDAGSIADLSSRFFSFTGTVSGAATWSGGVQLQNDPTVGDYIYVQPTNSPSANNATYTFQFSEPVNNYSFRTAGLNNDDRVVITAFNNATPISITSANFSDIQNDPGNSGSITITGNSVTSNNTAGGTGVTTNRFTTTIAGPVTKIVIVSGKSTTSTSTITLGFTSFAYTKCASPAPDVNATFVNVALTGNVSTNDVKPTGTTYGTATVYGTNPGPAIPTLNTDGTYSFTSAVPGIFRYTVPMYLPSVVSPDGTDVLLVITVSSPLTGNNLPFANIDRASTLINTAVTLNTLSNDGPGSNTSVALNPASVAVTTAPLHGSTNVNAISGNITYTPSTGYTGFDTLTYKICDLFTPTPNCTTAQQIITILPASAANSTVASDDFNSMPTNTAVTGNVSTNDKDPEGNTQTVTTQNVTIGGKGTLVLAANGGYTFTPVTAFSGPVNFPYQTCDNGTPQACTGATLYLLVYPTSVLPLSLVNFSLVISDANTLLTWKTENQINVDHFEIERSTGNTANYVRIGSVPVNNAATGNYSYTDINSRNLIANGYYRLKIIDRDGHYTYSRVLLVKFDKNISIAIRPNIVTAGEPVTISINSSVGNASYKGLLYNNTGQVVLSWKASTGSNKIMETGNLSKGMYLLKLDYGTGSITEKLIIQ
ncbi:MAG: Ig-like domain-containing protein [Ferruginibacter sp.]